MFSKFPVIFAGLVLLSSASASESPATQNFIENLVDTYRGSGVLKTTDPFGNPTTQNYSSDLEVTENNGAVQFFNDSVTDGLHRYQRFSLSVSNGNLYFADGIFQPFPVNVTQSTDGNLAFDFSVSDGFGRLGRIQFSISHSGKDLEIHRSVLVNQVVTEDDVLQATGF